MQGKKTKLFILLFLSVLISLGLFGVGAATEIPTSPSEVPTSAPLPSLSFSVVGDIMVHQEQLQSAYHPQSNDYDFSPMFSEVKELLSAADFTIGNLETTLPGEKKEYASYPLFGTPDALITALKQAGFDILTTANNHCLDKGKKGLERTVHTLDEQGLLHLGTYATKEEYQNRRILIIEKKGIKIALLNYTYGTNEIAVPAGCVVNLIDKDLIAQDILLARQKGAEVVMVCFHWGEEYQRRPNDFQKDLVAFTFQEGADIILGWHPHVLQPWELKEIKDKAGLTKPRLVVYSLGNFISGQPWRYTDGGIIFNFTLTKDSSQKVRIEKVHYLPVWVYVERNPSKIQFYVLPVEKYLKNDQPLKLPAAAYKRMLQFYQDTNTHVQPQKPTAP